jgi:hypothetical protein
MHNKPAVPPLLQNDRAPRNSHRVTQLKAHNCALITHWLNFYVLGNEPVKRRLRASRASANCREDQFKVGLDRGFPVESLRRLGLRKKDRRIFSETVDEALHVEIFECAKKTIYDFSSLLPSSAVLTASRHDQHSDRGKKQHRSHTPNENKISHRWRGRLWLAMDVFL